MAKKLVFTEKARNRLKSYESRCENAEYQKILKYCKENSDETVDLETVVNGWNKEGPSSSNR